MTIYEASKRRIENFIWTILIFKREVLLLDYDRFKILTGKIFDQPFRNFTWQNGLSPMLITGIT